MLTLIIFIIFLALVFDFLNGFHDAANSIATIVSTRVLTPRQAVLWAAFFNLVAAVLFDVHIAKTIGKGLIDILVVNEYVIMAGLVGAIVWNLITWYFGIPSSSSHALIGGYGGAAIAKAGFGSILLDGWIKTLVFIVVAPLLGMVMGYFLQVAVSWIVHSSKFSKVNGVFRKLQLLSAALYSLGHGTNDAQKTMGIITGLLVTAGAFEHLRGAVLGDHHLPFCDRPRDDVRRLADREDHGIQDHQTPSVGRVLRRDRRGHHAAPDRLRRDRRQHHAHDRRRDHGGGGDETALRRPLGDRGDHGLGLDPDDPGVCAGCCRRMVRDRAPAHGVVSRGSARRSAGCGRRPDVFSCFICPEYV